MTDSRLEKLLGISGRDAGCDAGFAVFDEYCEAVLRGEPVGERYAELLTHLGNCAACREDAESMLEALRELEKTRQR